MAVVKRDFRRLLEAAEQPQRTVTLRHGWPVAAFGRICSNRPDLPVARRPGGLLTVLGTFADQETMDAGAADVLAALAGRGRAARAGARLAGEHRGS